MQLAPWVFSFGACCVNIIHEICSIFVCGRIHNTVNGVNCQCLIDQDGNKTHLETWRLNIAQTRLLIVCSATEKHPLRRLLGLTGTRNTTGRPQPPILYTPPLIHPPPHGDELHLNGYKISHKLPLLLFGLTPWTGQGRATQPVSCCHPRCKHRPMTRPFAERDPRAPCSQQQQQPG